MFRNEEIGNQIAAFFSWDIIRGALANGQIPLVRLHALIAFMTRNDIAYDLSFSPGNGRDSSGLELTVFITPTVKVVLEVNLDPGPTSFEK